MLKLFFLVMVFFATLPDLAAAPSVEPLKKVRIAVLYFENNSSQKEMLAPLAKGLCDIMIADMKRNRELNVVERTRLEEILKELNLEQSKTFDQSTTQKIGKLLGAQYLVLGSYFDLLGKFRIDARIVKVETGEIVVAAGQTGRQNDFDILEQRLVSELLARFLPSAQKKSSNAADNGSNSGKAKVILRDANSYGNALGKADAGDKQGAVSLLKDIVESNPDFALAKQMLVTLEK